MPLSETAVPSENQSDGWRKWEVALVFFALLFTLARLGAPALRDYDEALYATIARDVNERGHWLSLTTDGSYYSHKPPLIFWLMAMSYRIFGESEFAARLPSALFGAGGIILTYLIGKRLWSREAGLLAAVVLMTHPLWLTLSRQAMLDVPLATLLACAAYGLLIRSVAVSGVASGLALMTKGPLALIAIALALVFTSCVRRDLLRLTLLSALAAFAVAAPWHIHQIAVHGREFTDYYFGTNVLSRLTKGMEGHGQGWTYYFEWMFFRKVSPWRYFTMAALVVTTWRALKGSGRREVAAVLSFWVPVLILTVARTKIYWYVTPLYVPLALMTGSWVVEHLARWRWMRPVTVLLIVLTLAQSALYAFHLGRKSPTDDTRRVLRMLPSSDHVPLLALSEGLPEHAVRFYARRPMTWCAPHHQPPPEAWVLTTHGQARAFGKRSVVASSTTRLLLSAKKADVPLQ